MIVVLDMVSHSHAWDWIKNKGNPQACTMNQNGTKFVDFIHGSKFRTSSASNKFQTQASGKLRLKHAQNTAPDFHHFKSTTHPRTPGAGLPHTSTLHELFSWRSLSAGLMREWHIEKAGNEPDRAKVSNSSDLAWRGCGNGWHPSPAFFFGPWEDPKEFKNGIWPVHLICQCATAAVDQTKPGAHPYMNASVAYCTFYWIPRTGHLEIHSMSFQAMELTQWTTDICQTQVLHIKSSCQATNSWPLPTG